MLESIYSRPYRVYICFLLLIIAGIFCYYSMPVALFPNSTKPEINIWIKYDNFTQDSFLKTYGKSIESSLKRLHYPGCNVEKVAAYYEVDGVRMEVITSWGDDAVVCLKEIEQYFFQYW